MTKKPYHVFAGHGQSWAMHGPMAFYMGSHTHIALALGEAQMLTLRADPPHWIEIVVSNPDGSLRLLYWWNPTVTELQSVTVPYGPDGLCRQGGYPAAATCHKKTPCRPAPGGLKTRVSATARTRHKTASICDTERN